MCFMKKTHVLDKLCSGISHSVVGCKFNVDETTMLRIQKNDKEFTNLYMRLLQKVL